MILIKEGGCCTIYIHAVVMLLFTLSAICDGSIYFKVESRNSSKVIIVCRYGKEFQEHYFDIYKNDGPCVTAGAGACAEVRDSGCKCEKRMGVNEVRLRIESPHKYDILKCRVLNGVSREKTINVTSNDGLNANKIDMQGVNQGKPQKNESVGFPQRHTGAANKAALISQPLAVMPGIACGLAEFIMLYTTGI